MEPGLRFKQGKLVSGFSPGESNPALGQGLEELEQVSEEVDRAAVDLSSLFDPVESLRNPDHHLFK